tara:strand:- start:504 stop:779 length:276 start_codon:yes stop_codon:yes gene_type:complete
MSGEYDYDFGFGELEAEHFVIGDLVTFTGYLYTPDYVYTEEELRGKMQLGIVIGTTKSGYYENILYRVHWLRTARVTEVVSAHLHLVYLRK